MYRLLCITKCLRSRIQSSEKNKLNGFIENPMIVTMNRKLGSSLNRRTILIDMFDFAHFQNSQSFDNYDFSF